MSEPMEHPEPMAPKPVGLDAHSAASVKAREITFLNIGKRGLHMFPLGAMSLVAGQPGKGKSTLTVNIAAAVSQKRGVVYSNVEDMESTMIVPRLIAAGANMDNVHFTHPLLPRDVNNGNLERFIVTHDVVLMILDPIAAHVETSIYNDQAVRKSLTPFAAMLECLGVACLAVHHTIKSVPKGAHPLHAVGGSTGGLVGAARAVFIFGGHPDDPAQRVLAWAKGNFLPEDEQVSLAYEMTEPDDPKLMHAGKLELLGKTPITATQLVREAMAQGVSGDVADKKLEAARWLVQRLGFGPQRADVLQQDARDAGLSWATVRRAADELVKPVKDRKNAIGGKAGQGYWEWRLPDDWLENPTAKHLAAPTDAIMLPSTEPAASQPLTGSMDGPSQGDVPKAFLDALGDHQSQGQQDNKGEDGKP